MRHSARAGALIAQSTQGRNDSIDLTLYPCFFGFGGGFTKAGGGGGGFAGAGPEGYPAVRSPLPRRRSPLPDSRFGCLAITRAYLRCRFAEFKVPNF